MKTKQNSLSSAILYILEKTVDGYCRFEDFTTNTYIYAYNGNREIPKAALSKALARLRKGGLVTGEKIDKKLVYKLSEIGKKRLSLPAIEKTDWDGFWCIASFDIPEQKRIIRNLFRRNLKRWGFKKIHKSVWATKQNVYQDLVRVIDNLQLSEMVVVIRTNQLSPEPHNISDRTLNGV